MQRALSKDRDRKILTERARALFLGTIEKRLADTGKPLSGFAMDYWRALAPEDERIVDLLWKERARRKELDAIEKEFVSALYDALAEDIQRDPARARFYLDALDDIKSLEGVQLQAIVFNAALRVRALQTPSEFGRFATIMVIALLTILGIWTGMHLRR